MNDRAVGLLDQYDLEVIRTRKGRGAILCDTSQGCLILKEYKGNPERCRLQERLLQRIREKGQVCVESIVPARDGQLLVKDHDGTSYLLKTYFDGRECSTSDRGECLEAVRLLARLHESMELEGTDELPAPPQKEYEKHNRELKRARHYLHRKGQKSCFEMTLQQSLDYFLEQAEEVTGDWAHYSHLTDGQSPSRSFCHGDYQYHNIIRCGNEWCVVNFEKCVRDDPSRDLYLLLRKLLEKSDWSAGLGRELLEAYEDISPLPAYSRIDLYYRLAYPEKFWKIVNFYLNSGKAWIPERNYEKLSRLLEQEEARQDFLEEVFRRIS